MKTIDKDIKNVEIAYRLRQGAKQVIKRLQEDDLIPEKVLIRVNENHKTKMQDLWLCTICNQCLNDASFLEAYIVGEEIKPVYGKEVIKGKEYLTLRFVYGEQNNNN